MIQMSLSYAPIEKKNRSLPVVNSGRKEGLKAESKRTSCPGVPPVSKTGRKLACQGTGWNEQSPVVYPFRVSSRIRMDSWTSRGGSSGPGNSTPSPKTTIEKPPRP